MFIISPYQYQVVLYTLSNVLVMWSYSANFHAWRLILLDNPRSPTRLLSSMYVISLSTTKMNGRPYFQQPNFCKTTTTITHPLKCLWSRQIINTTSHMKVFHHLSNACWPSKFNWSRSNNSTTSSLNASEKLKICLTGNLTEASITHQNEKWRIQSGWLARTYE